MTLKVREGVKSLVNLGFTDKDDVMIVGLLFLLAFVAIGLTIGVALLPWYKKLVGAENFPSFVRLRFSGPIYSPAIFGARSRHTLRLGGSTYKIWAV